MKQGIPVFLSWAPDSTLPSALLSSEWRGGALQALNKPPASHLLLEDQKYLGVKLSTDLMMPLSSACGSHLVLLSVGSTKGKRPMEKMLALLQYFYKWFSERISIDFIETREQQQHISFLPSLRKFQGCYGIQKWFEFCVPNLLKPSSLDISSVDVIFRLQVSNLRP